MNIQTTDDHSHILVVEDDTGLSLLVTDIIADMGHAPLQAADGKSALELLEGQQIKLMLLDFSLPDMTGLELLETVRQRDLHLPPFIVTTGAGDEQVAVELMKNGAIDYLVKDSHFLAGLPLVVTRALHESKSAHKLAVAEQSLHESEAYNKLLFQSSHQALVVLDPEEGYFIDCNTAAADIYGLDSREAVLNKTVLDVSAATQYDHSPSIVAAQEHIQQARTKGSVRFEWRHQRPDGEVWDAEVMLMAFHHQGKDLMQFTLLDVTERRRMQNRLKLAAQVLEGASEAVLVTDAQHRITDINPAFNHITGYSLEDMLNRQFQVLQPGHEDDQAILGAMMGALEAEGSWQGEAQLRNKDGAIFTAWFNVASISSQPGAPTIFVYLFSDISTMKIASERLHYLAHHDPLTGLPNRQLFNAQLAHSLKKAKRKRGGLGLLFLDLDRFKEVNDTLGHAAGDTLLQDLSQKMSGQLRGEDTLARFAGDEFVFMIEDASDLKDLQSVVDHLLALFPHRVDTPKGAIEVTGSIGGAIYPRDAHSAKELLTKADKAMYAAKAAGRNQYQHTTNQCTNNRQ